MPKTNINERRHMDWKRFSSLTYRILLAAGKGSPKIKFLEEILKLLIDFIDCSTIKILLKKGESYGCSKTGLPTGPAITFEVVNPENSNPYQEKTPTLKMIRDGGSLLIQDSSHLADDVALSGELQELLEKSNRECRCFALVFFELNPGDAGIFQFADKTPYFFSSQDLEFLREIARIVGLAFQSWQNTWSLQERVKEMSCLYGITQIIDSPQKKLDDLLLEILNLIPPAWLYADIASAGISLDGRHFNTEGFRNDTPRLKSDIFIEGVKRGEVEVAYSKVKPELDEGPFLNEERRLLDTISRELSVIIERKLYEKEKAEIKEQLQDADRLSMMGQLAGSVAHELNEPLTSILGFAQLAESSPGLPEQAAADIEKIIGVSLHAREIVRKLLMFARKMPARESFVELNQVVAEALGFFEHRCNKEGVTVTLDLKTDMEPIEADPGQLRQVAANLLVNAMQAMPSGGNLTLTTFETDKQVGFSVQDDGPGMDKEILDKIFIPFYTTKPAGKGTGLGLPVARDIINSHGGTIEVVSIKGSHTKVTVLLPKQKA